MFKPLRVEPKDPADQNTYGLDFTPDLDVDNGEAIQGVPVITTTLLDGSSSDLVVANPHTSNNVAYCFVSGGLNGKTYLVSYEVNTTNGNVIKRSVLLPVQDR